MRMRALGECGHRNLQQFAVLSYGKEGNIKNNLGFPARKFPNYKQNYVNDPVVSLGKFRIK